MLTRCPSCQTIFRMDAEILEVARGQVRCGRCALQFNALDNLLEELQAPAEAPPESDGEPAPSAAVDGVIMAEPHAPLRESEAAQRLVSEPESTAVANEAPSAEPIEPPLLSLEAITQSLLIEDRAPSHPLWRTAGGLLILLLLLLLMGQWLYMQRIPLYERPLMRPVLMHYCAVIGCDLPLLRMPERIEVLDRGVREHPRVAGALLATISYISRAEQTIAYPQLLMQLGDVSGNRVVSRLFAPAEYLPAAVDIGAGLRPGQSVQITLELVEPKLHAVSFHFEFY